MSDQSERMQILAMIDSGQISVGEGLKLLQALSDGSEPEAPGAAGPAEVIPAVPAPPAPPAAEDFPAPLPPPAPPEANGLIPPVEAAEPSGAPAVEEPAPAPAAPPDLTKWRSWWRIPLWVGVGVTVLGGALLYWAWLASGFSFWFACAWFPFLAGVALLAFAWASRNMRWLHVRVTQKDGDWPQRIAISLPLPVRLAAWTVRTFGSRIPKVGDANLDEMIIALENVTPEAPFYVEVDEDGEHVEVFIG